MTETFPTFLQAELLRLGRAPWSLRPVVVSSSAPGRAVVDGAERILLCSNDYLGLACDARVVEAAREAINVYGFGARGARALAGDTDVHRLLEAELAAFKGVEAALVFSSGFTCNIGVIGALGRAGDLICSDELNHASIVDGCRLAQADVAVYRHADPMSLAELLERPIDGRRIVVTDAVFSMEGDIAPAPQILALGETHEAVVVLDEAHATGVLGTLGKGTLEHFGLEHESPVLIGTLGKALGSVGGFVAGSRQLIDLVARTARPFLFTTSLPAAAAAAALASLRVLRDEPHRVARLWENARVIHAGLAELGYDIPEMPAPIIPVHLRDSELTNRVGRALFDRGLIVQAIAAPYVPEGAARLRVIASAAHEADDLEAALDAFAFVKTSLR